jgi:hypothetical protein
MAGIGLGAAIWVCTAALVAMPEVLFDLSKLYSRFFSTSTKPVVLATLIFVDLLIAYFLIPDDRIYRALTRRDRLTTVALCLAGFVGLGTLGVGYFHSLLDRNQDIAVAGAFFLLAIPRAISYAVPQIAAPVDNLYSRVSSTQATEG